MDNHQPSQNQPVTGSVSHLLWNLDRLLPVRKYITIMMKLVACHLSSDRVQKNNKLCDDFWFGTCINYVENKLDYVDTFQQLTKVIKNA